MTSEIVDRLRGVRSRVLARWAELLENAILPECTRAQWHALLPELWEKILVEFQRPESWAVAPSQTAAGDEEHTVLYATAERAFREALLAVSGGLDIRNLARAAERLSHAIARVRGGYASRATQSVLFLPARVQAEGSTAESSRPVAAVA